MSSQPPLINPINARELFETQTGGDRDFYLELIETQLAESANLINQLHNAQQTNDAQSLRRVTHTLKGTGKTFGLPWLAQAALSLEQESISHFPPDADQRIEELINIYHQSMQALQSFSKEL